MIGRRWGLSLLGLLLASVLAGCDAGTASDATAAPLAAAPSVPPSACPKAQGYQHATLGYRVCYPAGWVTRDYTAEPGAGGALSVVAFGPAGLPTHVPTQADFEPPLEIRVFAGSKAALVASASQGNAVTPTTAAGQPADRIAVTTEGPAMGEVIVIVQHDDNTFELLKGPGDQSGPEFEALLASFVFAQPGG